MKKAIKFFKTTFLTLCLSTSLVVGNCSVVFATEETETNASSIPGSGTPEATIADNNEDLESENNDVDNPDAGNVENSDSVNQDADNIEDSNDTDSDNMNTDNIEDSTSTDSVTIETPETYAVETPNPISAEINPLSSDSNAKIHFLTLKGNTLAVLLECNGHFGLVDAGEDSDYPSGDNPIYPFREGTVTDPSQAFENQVVEYLRSVGVTTENFDFFIGTHAHSDHLGGADNVIREFHPKRVYTPEYHDKYFQYNWRMFDNLYVYDQMLDAAEEVGSTIILNFDSDAPVDPAAEGISMPQLFINNSDYAPAQKGKYENISKERNTVGCPDFTLGDEMKIHIKNYKDNSKDAPLYDANEMSLAVLAEANGKKAYISGDIEAYNGDEDRLINEVPPVDIMTVSHHGWSGNSYNYIKHLSPDVMIIPGFFTHIKSSYDSYSSHSIYETLHEQVENGALLYPTAEYSSYTPALVFNFDEKLTNTIPTDIQYVGKFLESDTYLSYKDGRPYKFTGDLYCIDRYVHFENNYMSGDGVFIKENNRWRFLLSDGTYATDRYVHQFNDIYYIDHSGYMIKGWKKDIDHETNKTVWYYFDNSGAMVHGWDYIDGTWYCFDDATGHMYTGAQAIVGDVYCFTSGGAMLSNGWAEFDNEWYYLGSSGAAYKGWFKNNGYWYYLNETDGSMARGLTLVGDTYYYLGSSGDMYTGWILDNGLWYYATGSGAIVTDDWVCPYGNWYYMNDKGVITTGWFENSGHTYYLGSSGIMQTDWILVDNIWYYATGSGALVKDDWVCPYGNWYYMDANGAISTGWFENSGHTYYLGSSGIMQTDWILVDDVWYYASRSGALVKDAWVCPYGNWYYMNADGAISTGWFENNGHTYYLGSSGIMQTGWIYDNGEWYYLGEEGKMLKNTVINGYRLDSNGVWV